MLNDKQYAAMSRAINEVMFFDRHIDDVTFDDKMLSVIWVSIRHSLEASISGFISKNKITYNQALSTPTKGACQGATKGACQQGEGEVQEKGKEKEEYNHEAALPDDDKKFCFDSGMELLGKKAASIIGREIKKHGVELVADVIAEMQAKDFEDTSKLIGYFTKMCAGKSIDAKANVLEFKRRTEKEDKFHDATDDVVWK